MELIVIALITAANLLILKIKAELNRWTDLIFDIFVLLTLSLFFLKTLERLTIVIVSNFTLSVYLYFFPSNLKNIFIIITIVKI